MVHIHKENLKRTKAGREGFVFSLTDGINAPKEKSYLEKELGLSWKRGAHMRGCEGRWGVEEAELEKFEEVSLQVCPLLNIDGSEYCSVMLLDM